MPDSNSETISFKLSREPYLKLLEFQRLLNLQSHHIAAQKLLIMMLLQSDQSPQQELLEIRADVEHLIVEVERLTSYVASSVQFQASLSELLLVNLGNVTPEAASDAVAELFKTSFEEEG